MSDNLSFQLIEAGSVQEDAAFEIQEQYKKFFFVFESAFRKGVAAKQLLGAFQGAKLVAYVWTTCKEGTVRVRYLCVHSDEARKGIGRQLVEELKRRHSNEFRIQLSCRTDYPGWKFWKGVGFHALRNRPGKAKAGSEVTDFLFELQPFPLFVSFTASDERLKVAIDANVFFDLRNDQRPSHTESSGLLVEWIEADFELCVTAALEEDVDRGNEEDQAEAANHSWPVIEADKESFKCIHKQLIELVGPGITPQDISDRNHLTHAIAEDVHAFITRDEYLLERADEIYDQFRTSVVRPVDFVVNADRTSSQLRFDGKDLLSVQLSISGIAQADQDTAKLADLCRHGEKASRLNAKLRGWRANPDRFEVLSILDGGVTQAMAVCEIAESKTIVQLLRVSAKLRGTKKGRTILRCITSQLRARFSHAAFIQVADASGVSEASIALSELGFSFHNEQAFKVCLPGVWELEAAINTSNDLIIQHGGPTALLITNEQVGPTADPMTYLRLEHRLWPAKINSNGCVPCLAIPIKPRWARPLFDPNLGDRGLWDEDANLLLNPVNAYYTGARPSLEQGRILWYVSYHKNYSGSKQIRACSQMTRRVIAPPLQSFREFRHYGVYDFADINTLSKPKRPDVMAIEFRDTELFSEEMALPAVRGILDSPKEAFQWPTKVDESKFLEIYRQGTA